MNTTSWIAPNPEVFSKLEDDDKLLLVRPDGSSPPKVFLMKDPAPRLWQSIGRGINLDGLLTEEDWSPFSTDSISSILATLHRNRFINAGASIEPGAGYRSESTDILLDPWQYQFSRPYLSSPWFALWEVTDRCRTKTPCTFCYRPDDRLPDSGPDVSDGIIHEIVQNKVPFVTLLGGEPLCHEGIFDIIARLRSHKIFVKIITNGLLVNEEVASRLTEAGLNQIAVSLDGLTPETNDLTRGSGAFEMARKAIEILKPTIPRVSISLTISSASFEQLEHLPGFCREIGVEEVYFSPLRDVKRIDYPADVHPLNSMQMNRLQEVAAACNESGLKAICLEECSCGRSSCVIHADGELSPCPFGDKCFGNICEEGLSAVWSRVCSEAERIGRLKAGSFCFRRFDSEIESANPT